MDRRYFSWNVVKNDTNMNDTKGAITTSQRKGKIGENHKDG